MLRAMRSSIGLLAAAAALTACKGEAKQDKPTPVARDAGPIADAAPIIDAGPNAWDKLAAFPRVEPVRVIALPSRSDIPRFEVGGPVITGDVAIVSSSQFGFLAVDWRRGTIAWSRPAGLHVAPPLVVATDAASTKLDAILIGECLSPPEIPDGELLLGCLRVVSAAGVDLSYVAIHGKKLDKPGRGSAAVDAFARERGTQDVWPDGERAVRWRRGEQAVHVDLLTGVARPAASIAPPPVRVVYRDRRWEVSQTTEQIVATERGKPSWHTKRRYGELLGAVYLADQAPMIRVLNIGAIANIAELNLLDIDGTGSLHGQASFPVPAISTLGAAIDAAGNTAIAVRMDASLRHDYVVGYAANALLMYVYPLPDIPRADPVGVAVASDAVLAFHDGDLFTVLPELSAPPTAPGRARAPSQNPTP